MIVNRLDSDSVSRYDVVNASKVFVKSDRVIHISISPLPVLVIYIQGCSCYRIVKFYCHDRGLVE